MIFLKRGLKFMFRIISEQRRPFMGTPQILTPGNAGQRQIKCRTE